MDAVNEGFILHIMCAGGDDASGGAGAPSPVDSYHQGPHGSGATRIRFRPRFTISSILLFRRKNGIRETVDKIDGIRGDHKRDPMGSAAR